jgi:hypothetical protein
MDFVFVLIVIFALVVIVPRLAASAAKPTDGSAHGNQIIVEKKECPPHQ